MDKDWLKLHVSSKLHEVEMLRSYLLEHGIEAIILNTQDSAYGFGDVQLFVHRDQSLQARHLINSFNE